MLTLGEGNTPLLEVRTLAKQLEINKLFIKPQLTDKPKKVL